MKTKVCTRCTTEKSVEDNFRKKGGGRPGLRAECNRCLSEASAGWNRTHPEAYNRNRKSAVQEYNDRRRLISKEDYQERLSTQSGVCAICFKPPGKKQLAVDHCHTEGHVRGLLCTTCNLGLGCFKDDPIRLQDAINYLKKSRP